MSVIHIPRRNFVQPQGRVAIAPEWMQRSPVALWAPCAPGADAVSGGVHPYAGSTVQTSEIGLSYQHTARVLPGTAFPRLDGRLPLTILAYCNPNTTRAAIYTQRNGSGNNELGLRVNESSANNVSFWNFPAAGAWNHGIGTLDGRWQLIGATFSGEEDRIYADGELLMTLAATSGASPAPVAIGGLPDSTAIPYTRGLGLLATFQSALTADEIAELSRNPWQLFHADPIRIYSFPTGPISLTINSITASNITSSGARITLGLTR